MILVLGATAHTGGQVVRYLRERGDRFRAGYRRPEEAEKAKQQGIETVLADYERPETLRAAMEGVTRVFFVTPPSPRQGEWEHNILEAAKASGDIRHLVKLSVHSADERAYFFARLHRDIEEEIEASGIPYTFLRPNGFFQNLLASAPLVRDQGVIVMPGGDAPVSEIDVSDIGRVAAIILTTDTHGGKAYNLTGPAPVTGAEKAAVLSELLGRPIQFVAAPDDQWKQQALGFGIPEWNVDGILDLQHFYRTGNAAEVSPLVEELTGSPPVDFRRFAEQNLAAFR
jgi:uncharacterized protein YbjT (DUF2867 family)